MAAERILDRKLTRFKAVPRRARPEEKIQRDVAKFLDAALPTDAVWWHTPNGGGRSKAEAGALKAQGVKPGVPDVVVFWRGKLICIELKAPGGYPSPAQKLMRDRLQAAGAEWFLARSLEAVQFALLGQDVPLRGRLVAVAMGAPAKKKGRSRVNEPAQAPAT